VQLPHRICVNLTHVKSAIAFGDAFDLKENNLIKLFVFNYMYLVFRNSENLKISQRRCVKLLISGLVPTGPWIVEWVTYAWINKRSGTYASRINPYMWYSRDAFFIANNSVVYFKFQMEYPYNDFIFLATLCGQTFCLLFEYFGYYQLTSLQSLGSRKTLGQSHSHFPFNAYEFEFWK